MAILIILSILVVLYFYFTWNYDFWSKLNVPHEKPKLFFGSIKEVISGTKHFGVFYKGLYEKFSNVPYFGYYKIRQPAVIIRDPELIKSILVKDYSSFSSNDFQVDPDTDPIWGQNIFSQNGETWKKNRSAWGVAFTSSKLKSMYDIKNKKCDNMINFIGKQCRNRPNEPLETRQLASKLFIDMVLSSVMDIEYNSFESKDNPYRKIAQSMFVSTFWNGLLTYSFMFFPTLAKIFKIRFVPKRTAEQMISIARKFLKKRHETGFQKNHAFDSILIHNDIYKGVSEVEVAGIFFSFLVDGTETSSGVLAFLLYELSKNPDIQNKLRAEIDEAFEAGGGNISYEQIQSLQYLDMVISETMRLYPPAMSMQRLCTKPYSLPPIGKNGKPVEIPVGMTVIVPAYGIHMDPKYYPNPEKFDPEHFSEENKAKATKYTYLPFGEGPRICIGFRMALNQTKIGVVHLLRNFDVKMAPVMQNRKVEVDPNIFVMKAVGDLWVTFQERSHSK